MLDVQDYNLRDPASILKTVQHSDVVINLVGRDYETWLDPLASYPGFLTIVEKNQVYSLIFLHG